jgi:hypothetical protein
MEDLLPRWGGSPNDAREYADRVAAAIGGDEGDAAYATLVIRLLDYHQHGIKDELGFDPQRFQRGLDYRFRDHLDRPEYLQLGVMLAGVAGDAERTKKFAAQIKERRIPYFQTYLNEGAFYNLLQNGDTNW